MKTNTTSLESATLELPAELSELQSAIDGLSTESKLVLQPLFQRVVESTNRRRKILQMVQESIGQLRLDMKYLVFDLEATRRERDELQRQVSDSLDEDFGPEGN
ncbi:MAG: transcriptional regulator [Pirellula sp.]